MRKTLPLLSVLIMAGALLSGCAYTDKVETKFGRGVANTADIVRAGEFRRSMEQTALFQGPETAYSTGFFRGINRTLSRTGIGIYEVVTAPIPPFHPVATDHFAPGPVYPDNYNPGVVADSAFATDTLLGFSGGPVLPMVPGSRFTIFEMH
jgi:putative exosortase-associated protein (TIGR04073 family)